jgi:hypothetical protein
MNFLKTNVLRNFHTIKIVIELNSENNCSLYMVTAVKEVIWIQNQYKHKGNKRSCKKRSQNIARVRPGFPEVSASPDSFVTQLHSKERMIHG